MKRTSSFYMYIYLSLYIYDTFSLTCHAVNYMHLNYSLYIIIYT